MTVTHEDTILLLVLSLLHPKLPSFIRDIYSDRLRGKSRIMDYKSEILKDADEFMSDKANHHFSDQDIETESNIKSEEKVRITIINTITFL